ncbi:glycoside hydrolase family 128 protein [Piloderma croceum F 1598]|uniref:Glycoside hydrolase family 128 protein n=1 Tax=Piloderma croceum (strain F 1598) TaxID=765440 RepID=A0A0C3EQG7_PILCF|nr:glycoside hydrolase family 128 protein [Piloderma croceum F 1598]
MVPNLAAVLGALTLALSFAVPSAGTSQRGLAWAANNNLAPKLGSPSIVKWYHHWQNGPVSQMPSKNEYVPMFWGEKYRSLWNERVAEMNKKAPKNLMSLNEPDVVGQANMDPNAAADLYMKEVYPWSKKGVKLCTPAIVWNLKWMQTFLSAIKKQGGHADMTCMHWYGSWKDLAGLQKYVEAVHSLTNMPVWIPELGVTTASNPSESQLKTFMTEALTWLDAQPYVERYAWFGCWESNNPPDNFATSMNAFLNPQGQLSEIGSLYASSTKMKKRSLHSHHLLGRNETQTDTQTDDDAVHCDTTCEIRNKEIEEYFAQLPPTPA